MAILVVLLGATAVVVFRSEPGETPVSEPAPEPPPAGSPASSPAVEADDTDTRGTRALLVVGERRLSPAESAVRNALRAWGFGVEVVRDADSEEGDAHDVDVVVISKTVQSEEVGATFKSTGVGILFWEDNAQAVETGGEQGQPGTGTPMLATIQLVNPPGTAWHRPGTTVHVNPDAPADLRGGLSGEVRFYVRPEEMTFAPKENGTSTVASSATWVAEFSDDGDGRYVYYVIEADGGLADGTQEHGRRVYFGLYDASFTALTDEGLRLFEAAVEWAAAQP